MRFLAWVLLAGCTPTPALEPQTPAETLPDPVPEAPPTPLYDRPLGAFGIYRVSNDDVFPDLPRGTAPPAFRPVRGSWHWSTSETRVGVTHTIVVPGLPADTPSELALHANAPVPKLPPGAKLFFHGHDWSMSRPEFLFESVAVVTPPLVDATGLVSCRVDHHRVTDSTHAQDVETQEPWIAFELTADAEKRLIALGPDQPLTVAFGDEALTLYWFPNPARGGGWLPPSFEVQALGHPAREERAKKLIDACNVQRAH